MCLHFQPLTLIEEFFVIIYSRPDNVGIEGIIVEWPDYNVVLECLVNFWSLPRTGNCSRGLMFPCDTQF